MIETGNVFLLNKIISFHSRQNNQKSNDRNTEFKELIEMKMLTRDSIVRIISKSPL